MRNSLYYVTAAFIVFGMTFIAVTLVNSAHPTAHQIAIEKANSVVFNVADFKPGDVKIVERSGLPIVIWRRSQDDIIQAKKQNNPRDWHIAQSKVFGEAGSVYASDDNLTLENEWFVAVAITSHRFSSVLEPRLGDFDGFFDLIRADHFDLSGRFRKGIAGENLKIIRTEYTNDRSQIRLNLFPPQS